ncbi:MAG TPA: amino acid adenylation domain-containing protein, partial [Bacteroidales bacterium]|nr:amino acid adenylation domain-containing protein [Bacteroidales bacterium]
IRRMIEYFKKIVAAVITAKNKKLSEIEILSEEEKNLLLYDFNDTSADYPRDKVIHRIFEEQVEKCPDRIAVTAQNPAHAITYREFSEQADRLAHKLNEKGAQPGCIVGIKIERSLEMMVGIFGILKSGSAYLPIDPEYPQERIEFMLKDSSAGIMIRRAGEQKVESVEFMFSCFFPACSFPRFSASDSSNLAYIIYTSGSTGNPKGVMIEHHSVVNRLHWMQKCYSIGPGDVILQKTPTVFDVSVWELFWWSMEGASLCLLGVGEEKIPEAIIETIARNKVTTMHFVPSMLQAFMEYCEDAADIAGLSSLRQVFSSGEALVGRQVEKFNRLFNEKNGTKLINLYGPTEATVDVSYYDCIPGENINDIPIGRPIDNIALYILDKNLNLQPVGVKGELCISGVGLARGYLNRPELTAEKFIDLHRLSLINHHSKFYRTGDLARVPVNGQIEYLGRMDHQVKIRGLRIELGEIENQLLSHEGIKGAAVLVQDQHLYAYIAVKGEGEFNISLLRNYLSEKLPVYMIPSTFVQIEEIPLTANGKVDRKKLPLPQGSVNLEGTYIEPQNREEMQLAEIWQEVLELERVGIDDNFFKVGGDSIKTIRLTVAINRRLNSHLKILDLYTHGTIRQLATLLDREEAFDREYLYSKVTTEIEALKAHILEQKPELTDMIEDIYPMSDIEKGMVFYYLKNVGTGIYHDQFVYPIYYKNFDVKLFAQAINLMVEKHPALRTIYNLEDFEESASIVYKRVTPDFTYRDMSELSPAEQNRWLTDFLAQDRQTPFVESVAPLWRIGVFDLGEGNLYFILVVHHAVLDGWSVASLATEVHNTYLELKNNLSYVPSELKSTYKDALIEELIAKQDPLNREYWKQELEEYPRLEFSETLKSKGEMEAMTTHWHNAGPELLEQLNRIADRRRTSIKNLCFGAYACFMNMFSFEDDVVVGVVTNTRTEKEDGDKVLGCFLNTVPVRLKIPRGITWKEYIELVERKMLEVKKHERLSLFEIAAAIGEKSKDRNPIFDSLFNFMDFHILRQAKAVEQEEQENSGKSQVFVINSQDTNTLFDFEMDITQGTVRLCPKYNRSAISDDTVKRCCGYFLNILQKYITEPEGIVRNDEILSTQEKEQVLYRFNDTAAPYGREKTMHQLFEEQVSRAPGRVAVIDRDGILAWTYEELNKQANQLGRLLGKKGLKSGGLTAVIMERSILMVAAVMGILKAGGAYVPLEPYLPEERIRKILESLHIETVITNKGQLFKVAEISQTLPLLTHIICLDKITVEEVIPEEKELFAGKELIDGEKIAGESSKNLPAVSRSEEISYIIFTSGSTGTPKGVVETHRPVINVVEWVNKTFEVGYPDKLLFVASLSFDLSVYDIFGILASGACLRVTAGEDIKDPGRLLDIIMNEGITFWDSAPAALQQLVPFLSEVNSYPEPSRLRLVFLSGDWIPVSMPDALREAFEGVQVISLGGATEATVWSNYYPIGQVDPSWPSIPYGKPIQNAKYYILDRNLEICPLRVPGDLYIGGECLAKEYIHDEMLSAHKFIANPFAPGEKIYRTGDIARWFENGNMQFLGRKDHQVKIRGYRIELGEIESQLVSHPLVSDGIVLDRMDGSGNKYLCAYYVCKAKGEEIDREELKEYLSRELPEYMIPAYFIPIEKIPLTANGKLDRKALPEPEASSESGGEYAAPENETQEKLVEIWSQVLGVEKETIGITADFFELGGHSLNATMVISRIHKELNVKVPLAEIFNSPTIRELARKIKNSESEIYEMYATIEPVEKKEYYRLSSAQMRLYFLQQMEPGNTGYNIQEGLLLEGDVDIPLLEETFRQLIRRHESLRTSFEIVNEETVQRVHDNVEFKIELLDGGEPMWSTFIRAFDLSRAPLLRVGLFRLEEMKYLFLADMHHIISDGVSQAVLKGDFGILYGGGRLPAIRLQYKDYSEWQYSEKQQQLVRNQKAYWLKELSGDIPVLDIPTDFPRPAIQSYEGNTLHFDLNHEETGLLNKLGLDEKATLYMVLLAIYNVLLFKLSNQEEIIIGTPTAGRPHSDFERIIGMFVNTLALKNYLEGEKTFISFLEEVKDNTIKAFENQDCQFEELVEQVEVKRDTARNPLFDVLFVLQNMEVETEGTPGDWGTVADGGDSRVKLLPYRYNTAISKFDLTLMAIEGVKGIHFSFEYCTRLFKEETIRRMIEYFKKIVAAVITAKNKKLSEIEILSEEEKNLLLYDFNDTSAD